MNAEGSFSEALVLDEGRAIVKLCWKQAEVFIQLEENALMGLKRELSG